MQIILSLPYAETYQSEIPPGMNSHKKLYEYTKKFLLANHPGFTEESLWDYFVKKKGNSKTVCAFVLDRDFYIKKRVTESNVSFIAQTEDGRRIKLFKKRKFTQSGRKKQIRKFFIVFLLFFVPLFFLLITFFVKDLNKEKEVITEAEEITGTTELKNSFDILNGCASVIIDNGGHARTVSLTTGNSMNVDFAVYGCEPYELVKQISENENITECRCGTVSFADGNAQFDLHVEFEKGGFIQEIPEEIELLELLKSITESLKDCGITVNSVFSDAGSGTVNLLLSTDPEHIKNANSILPFICAEKGLFITVFTERFESSQGIFFIEVEFIKPGAGQKILPAASEEKLSLLFEAEKKEIIKPSQRKTEPLSSAEKTGSLKKIGSVKKQGKTFFYYRTEEGKTIVSEDDGL